MFRGIVYYVLDKLMPNPDVKRSLAKDLEEAKRELIVQIGAYETAELNISYLEKKIARLSKILETDTITTHNNFTVSLASPKPNGGVKNNGTDPVL